MMERGLATIVATLLIIALTVIAGAILVGIVVPFVREGLQGSTRCLTYEHAFVFNRDLPYNCIRNHQLLVSIAAAPDTPAQIAGFELLIHNATSTYRLSSADSLILLNGSRSNYPRAGETRTYNLTLSNNEYTSADLRIILTSGDSCDAREQLSIEVCS